MKDLPPPGSDEYRQVVGFLLVLTVLFAAVLVYGLYRWARGDEQPPLPALLAALGGLGSLVVLWRSVVERSRARGVKSAATRQRAAVGSWVYLTAFFGGMLAVGVDGWVAGTAGFAVLVTIGGIGAVICVWRLIAEQSRYHDRRGSPSS